MDYNSSFIPKLALNKRKAYAILTKCPKCNSIWWSVAKRRFTKCLSCDNLVIVNRRCFNESKVM
jgi:hypothetical protein